MITTPPAPLVFSFFFLGKRRNATGRNALTTRVAREELIICSGPRIVRSLTLVVGYLFDELTRLSSKHRGAALKAPLSHLSGRPFSSWQPPAHRCLFLQRVVPRVETWRREIRRRRKSKHCVCSRCRDATRRCVKLTCYTCDVMNYLLRSTKWTICSFTSASAHSRDQSMEFQVGMFYAI